MKIDDLINLELDVRRDLATLATDTVSVSEAHEINTRVRSALGRLAQTAEASPIPAATTEARRLQDHTREQAAQILQQYLFTLFPFFIIFSNVKYCLESFNDFIMWNI